MKADAQANRVNSAKKPRLRYLDLSFESKESGVKGGTEGENGRVPLGGGYNGDNGKLPHGGYKGSKKHPLGIYSFDKGRDYQHAIRHDLDKMLEGDVLEVHGSPTWALEAHRQPTHSGESPLFTNRFMSASKYESVNGTGKFGKDLLRPNRCSAPPSHNGVMYYRPNRTHQYLTATELKDASDGDDALKYGRPTRTTLLRARQRAGSASSNAYELRRQLVQRMDEIKNGCVFSNPKEFVHHQHTDIEGQSFHSFLTGARYNRAHCLDSKSLTQYGVYMPRNNPLGCFVIGHRDILDTTSAPPDSPRSDIDEGLAPVMAPRRPTTAPGYGRRRAPHVPPTPRQAWGDASTSVHITNGDHTSRIGDEDKSKHVVEEVMIWGPGLNVKGMRLPLAMAREGPARIGSKLPSVHGTSLSKLQRQQKENADDTSDANQPPPSPVPTSAREDNPLPLMKPGGEADRKSDPEQSKLKPDSKSAVQKKKPVQTDRSINVPSVTGSAFVAVAKNTSKPTEEAQNEAAQNGGAQETTADGTKPMDEEKGEAGEPQEKEQEKEQEKVGEAEATGATDDASQSVEPKMVPSEQFDETPSVAENEQAPASPKEGATVPEGNDVEPAAGQSASEEADHVPEEATSGVQAPAEVNEVNKTESEQKAENDSVKFFLTEEGAETATKTEDTDDNAIAGDTGDSVVESSQRIIGDDVLDFSQADEKQSSAPDVDQASISSKGSKGKSKGKRNVTFSEEHVKAKTDDVRKSDAAEIDDVKSVDADRPESGPSNYEADAEDNEIDDNDLGESQVEPLKVIVTHIERSSADGSPVPETGAAGSADIPSNNDPGENTTEGS